MDQKAWRYRVHGPSSKVLKLEDIPRPKVTKPNDVLVKVAYVGLNPVDLLMIQPGPIARFLVPPPAIIGLDFSGVVEAVGAQVKRVNVGDSVWGKKSAKDAWKRDGGTAAQYVLVAEKDLCKTQLPLENMAGMGIVGLTAMQTIDAARVRRNARILVNGASGGVGSILVQIAKLKNLFVTGVCSTKNIDFVRGLGADEVIDYTSIDVVKYLSASYKVHPFDAVLDFVGSPDLFYAMHNFTNPESRFVSIIQKPTFNSALSIGAMSTLPGFLGGGRRPFVSIRVKEDTAQLDQLQKWCASGKLRPIIDEVYRMDEMLVALEHLESRRARGKLVVGMSSS